MKNVLRSLVTIFLVLAAATGTTFAVFTEEAVIPGNTISTGTLNIDLRALDSGETAKPFDLTGLVPGEWSPWARAEVYNESDSVPVRVFFYVRNLSGDACHAVDLQLATGHAAGDEHEITVYNGPLTALLNTDNAAEITGPGRIFDPALPVNTTAVVTQRVKLNEETDNTPQNATCTWDEVFVGESAPATENNL